MLCRGQDSTMYYWVLMWVHFNDICVLCQDRIENDALIMSLTIISREFDTCVKRMDSSYNIVSGQDRKG